MKKFLHIIGLAILLAACEPVANVNIAEPFYPEPTNYVVDSAGVLGNVDALNADLKAFDSTAQIAVVTVKTTYPLSDAQYGIKLAEKWKVGHAGADNGLIILIATEDRKLRIEIGKGLEGTIPDSVAGRIVDESMIPYLKKNDWRGAVDSGVAAFKARITK